jgi:hypothetical protein
MPNFYYLSRFSGHFLKSVTHYTAPHRLRLIIQLSLMVLFAIVFAPAHAQNTKGDQPGKPSRETRFGAKQKKSKKQKASSKRISPKGKSQATSGAKGAPGRGEAWTGDITGRKIRATKSGTRGTRNIHPQSSPRTYSSVGDDAQQRAGTKPPKRIKPRSASGSARNVFPQRGPYVKKVSPPQRGDAQRFRAGTKTIQPKIRSATGSTRNVFPQRGPYVAKSRPPARGDAQIKWGRKASSPNKVRSTSGPQWSKGAPPARVRSATGTTRNVFPQRGPYVRGANLQPRQTEKPPGEKKKRSAPLSASKPFIRNKSINPYAGFWNKKQKSEQAHIGDISGKTLRRRNYESPRAQGVIPSLSPYARFKGRKSGDTQYTGKAAGKHVTATQGPRAWLGDIAGRKIRTRNASSKGKVEAGKPLGKQPYTGDKRIGDFSGSLKASRKQPGKEEGGIVGKFKITSVTGISKQGAGFTGNLKARKPQKGGGSVSGQLWNNNEKPLAGRAPRGSTLEMGAYQGSIKARKKEPGAEANPFPGKYRLFDLHPSMRKQGADFTGHIRRSKLKNDYIRNSYASKDALLKMRPAKPTFLVDGVHVRVKQQPYDKKRHAPNSAMPGIIPGKETKNASEYARGKKQDWKYVHNPSSADEALKIRDHRKAMARVTDYQGNIKMKKYELFSKKNLHPDAKFVKTNKNNVKEERNTLTNFKLLWARLFKKNDTQPDHLKEKIRKPRYDKGEVGLWYN